jgi:hypothetical protein
MHVRCATSNFLQLVFDREPWAPTLPGDFVVVPDEIRQLSQRLSERCRSGKQKTTTPSGKLNPTYREKFPTVKLDGNRAHKKPSGGLTSRTGEVYVVGSTAPPIEMYHCAQGWKNSTVQVGTFPG